jgi:hypothetical protein
VPDTLAEVAPADPADPEEPEEPEVDPGRASLLGAGPSITWM